MNIFYMIFFYPIEVLMKFLLEHLYSLVGSYGISIILTSLAINILMIPVFWYAERLQQRERDVQALMRPKIEEYKGVFKGYELHLYINNLYKMHNYNPVYALRSLLGLFIQLPFFVATYNFLSNYKAVEGISFLFIGDLGKADMLVPFFNYSINLLPFVMTFVNIAASFVYGKLLTKTERINIYVIAVVFLVILYNSPSGLLLYWTCNNIFSLFKSMVFAEQIRKKSKVL